MGKLEWLLAERDRLPKTSFSPGPNPAPIICIWNSRQNIVVQPDDVERRWSVQNETAKTVVLSGKKRLKSGKDLIFSCNINFELHKT